MTRKGIKVCMPLKIEGTCLAFSYAPSTVKYSLMTAA